MYEEKKKKTSSLCNTIPYAPSFLHSLVSAGSNQNVEYNNRNVEPKCDSILTHSDELICHTCTISFGGDFFSVISLSAEGQKYVSGFGYLKTLWGNAILNGTTLSSRTWHEFLSPPWLAAYCLLLKESKICSKVSDRMRLIEDMPCLASISKSTKHQLSQGICCIVIRSLSPVSYNWRVACEDLALFRTERNAFPVEEILLSPMASVTTAMISTASYMHSLGICTTCYPQDWKSAVESYLEDMKSGLNPKAVVCGAKGVGKSSLIRYLVNRVLSKHSVVALIDCDIGQPECNPPGMVSLHLLQKPIHSPPHLNLRTPELSFYLGDVSTKHIPEIFVQTLKLLYERFCELQSQYSSRGARAATNSQNSFSVLSDTAHAASTVPLIVNTDGWIRYMGAELLGAVLEITQPSHIMHICTPKNESLEVLSRAPIGSRLHVVRPVTSSKSRVTAVNLRTLRLVPESQWISLPCCCLERSLFISLSHHLMSF